MTDREPSETTSNVWVQRARRFGVEIVGTLLVVMVVGYALGRMRAPALPEQAPAFALKSLDGETVSLSDFEGQTVVLNFWATWCGPCRFEVPAFSRFARANPDIPVLGIAQDRDADLVRKTAQELGADYPIALGDQKTLRAYGIDTFPTTVVVGPDGAIRVAHVGIMLDPQLWFATR